MILAHNLNTAMKRLVLGKDWATKRMKALRFRLIGLPGRVVSHARKLIIRLGGGAEALATIVNARQTIRALALDRPDEPKPRVPEPKRHLGRRPLARRRRPCPRERGGDSPRLHPIMAGLAMRADELREVMDNPEL